MTELEQLKQLVLEGGYDEESRKEVAQLEERLQKVLLAENLIQNPIIQDYVTYLTAEADRCTVLLANDRKLTDLERQILFEKRDLCQKFTLLFNGSEKESIEETINHYLELSN